MTLSRRPRQGRYRLSAAEDYIEHILMHFSMSDDNTANQLLRAHALQTDLTSPAGQTLGEKLTRARAVAPDPLTRHIPQAQSAPNTIPHIHAPLPSTLFFNHPQP